MASYTIEDIELIRRKSGISYQEAVALLDYHNGNVARALIDLERNGRIKPEGEQKQPKKDHQPVKTASSLFTRAFRFRIKVHKENTVIANISLLYALLALLISAHLVIISAIILLVLGYRVSFDKRDPAFAGSDLEKMIRNAGENVKSSVNDFAKGFADSDSPKEEKAEEDDRPEAPRSYYQANPAASAPRQPQGGSAPTIQVPVQVESREGTVTVEQGKDGSATATIE